MGLCFFEMDSTTRKKLIAYLSENFVTPERWQKIQGISRQRTRHLTVVLENIYQSHNASAVLRSCEGFGIQDVHVVENRNVFDASPQVTLGADHWLTIHRYKSDKADNTERCIASLKKAGYRVVATSPHKLGKSLHELPVSSKTALIFGAELDGISKKAETLADGFVHIPMAGFAESLNVSVSAAVCLYVLTHRMKESGISWKLTEAETNDLQLQWLMKSIKAGKQLVKTFLETQD